MGLCLVCLFVCFLLRSFFSIVSFCYYFVLFGLFKLFHTEVQKRQGGTLKAALHLISSHQIIQGEDARDTKDNQLLWSSVLAVGPGDETLDICGFLVIILGTSWVCFESLSLWPRMAWTHYVA